MALLMGLTAAIPAVNGQATSTPSVTTSTSKVRGSDGKYYTATDHLVVGDLRPSQEYLLTWAGSVNPAEPDFMAVVDATKDSPMYGKVVNTVTLGPGVQNEPHHTEYVWHKGDMIYAGGLASDTIFVLDPTQLPLLKLRGINLPMDTPCGSVPDAFQALPDGTAYGTEIGGPNVSGPCTYTDGQVRVGNGYAGSPGEVVHLSSTGKTLSESPAATATGESPANCVNIPALPDATCANPHGIAVRQDLKRIVTSDFVEIRQADPSLVGGTAPTSGPDPSHIVRDTVRIWDISKENDPKVISVSTLPEGPRPEQQPMFKENRAVMEDSVTNLANHRGAFVATMWGGAIYYTPDITKPDPVWTEVFDDETAYGSFLPAGSLDSGGDGGSWLAVSPNDKYLYHVVMGVQDGASKATPRAMLYTLNIQKLLATGEHPTCQITDMNEVQHGGTAPDCPTLAGAAPILDTSSGGPHWGAMNNFAPRGRTGLYRETTGISQIAVANYFVAGTGLDGNHLVCMYDIAHNGAPSLDTTFRDEVTGRSCVDFNRTDWPQGATGPARPHGVMFALAGRDVR